MIPRCNPSGGKLLLRSSASYNKSLGRVALRNLSKIQDEAFLQKQGTAIRRYLFPQKTSTVDVRNVVVENCDAAGVRLVDFDRVRLFVSELFFFGAKWCVGINFW